MCAAVFAAAASDLSYISSWCLVNANAEIGGTCSGLRINSARDSSPRAFFREEKDFSLHSKRNMVDYKVTTVYELYISNTFETCRSLQYLQFFCPFARHREKHKIIDCLTGPQNHPWITQGVNIVIILIMFITMIDSIRAGNNDDAATREITRSISPCIID